MARRCPYACDELNGHAAQTDRQLKQQKEQLYRFQLEKDQRAKEALSQQARASQASSNNSAAYSAPQGAVYEEVYRGVETPTSFARYRSKPLSPSNQAAQLAKARAKADLAAALDLQIAEKQVQREAALQPPYHQQQQQQHQPQQQRLWRAAAPSHHINERALSSPRQLALTNTRMPNWQVASTRTAAAAPVYQLNSNSTYSSDNSSTCERLMQQVAAHEVALRTVQAQLRALQTITSYNSSPVTWQGADFTARSHGTGIQSRDPWKRFQQEDDQLDRLLNDYAASKITPRSLPALC
eukprot:3075-Heterococcus_DN1.PRE.1